MPTLQQLRDQRANVWDQMTKYNDEASAGDSGWTAELSAAYDKAEFEFDKITADIDRQERHDKRQVDNSKVDRKGVVPPEGANHVDDLSASEVYAQAFELFIKNGMTDMDPDARKTLRSGRAEDYDAKQIRNAGGVGTGSAGGYLVPEDFRAIIIEKMKAYGNVEAVATTIDTPTGGPLPWATNDDTGNVGALLAENTAAGEQDFVYGTEQLGAFKYTSKLFRESIEFLQDVAWMDIEAFLGRKAAERLGRILNQHYTNGTGSNQPLGLVTGCTQTTAAAGTTAIAADEMIDLQHAVDPAYRNERSQYMLTDTALKGIRKLKASGTGDYLFQPAYTAGIPTTIAGRPYVINNDMAVPAAGVKSVLYGDFQAAYVIRRVLDIEFMRLTERFAEYGQVGFIAFMRRDATVQDANAYVALTQAAS